MRNKLKSIIGIFILFLSMNCWAIDINRYLSGTWWNPGQSGHGFSIEVISEETTIVYWYVYNPDGSPTFLIAPLSNNGNIASGTAYVQWGMKFGEFNPATFEQIPWGTLTLTFHSCESATLQYNSTVTYGDEPFGSGTISLQLYTPIHKGQCSNNPYAGIYIGFWDSHTEDDTAAYGILAPDGNFVAVVEEGVGAYGVWSAVGNRIYFSGNALTLWPHAPVVSPIYFTDGEIIPDSRLRVDARVPGCCSGKIDWVAASTLYRTPATINQLAGRYDVMDVVTGNYLGRIWISVDGGFTYTDSFGCNANGQFALPDPKFNLLNVSIVVSNCGSDNGTYNGYGAVVDNDVLGDQGTIIFVAYRGTTAAVISLER